MKATRLVCALAAMIAVLASPGVANAATIVQPFAADTGGTCRYGATSGTLGWLYGTTSPLPVTGVEVKGQLTDRPLPNDPSAACLDDGYYSVATFTAYAGNIVVARKTSTANNSRVAFDFTLGGNAPTTGINLVVVQVCRSPINTLPPTYCGPAVQYTAPPIA